MKLLTTEPAFGTTDRAQLVSEIVHTDPLPPRRHEPRLPRDLETIVLKAMAKDPSERYATASDMAADLRRFLDDKPIGARRLSVGERLWRWCVRRPALASLAAALLLSLVVGVGSVAAMARAKAISRRRCVKRTSRDSGRLPAGGARAEDAIKRPDRSTSCLRWSAKTT
jgi:hypothetical protein